MAVRATYFRCGGVAVGIRISHKIADGLTFISFVNTWSAVAIGNGGAVAALLKFDAAAYFPPLDILGSHGPTIGVVDEEVAARVFTFPASQIAALRERYTGPGGHRPSRVESLSAFIWTRFTSATGIGSDPGKNCVVYNAVNLRSRAKPPLSEYHFGNVIGATRREVVAGDDGVEFLRKLREATEALDADYVAGLKDREMQLEVLMDFARVNKMEVEVAARDGSVELLRKLHEASEAVDAGHVARMKNSEVSFLRNGFRVGHTRLGRVSLQEWGSFVE
ncbi:vinorine synthase-like [Salvia miltiorrhiza]|uniref:vinorine synthase-like n=1 Tax=Salvia miltiorrhiza TaxID=226208 RepID=UPI0025AC7790|nr:vinorine synthase-like [Salvia miltiorrhiza]